MRIIQKRMYSVVGVEDEDVEKMTLDKLLRYEITVAGVIEVDLSDWMDVEITLTSLEQGNRSIMKGTFDQAALQGVLQRIYSFGYPLISVICVTGEPA